MSLYPEIYNACITLLLINWQKRNITRPPALQWVYLDRAQANLKLHSSEHDYDQKKIINAHSLGPEGCKEKEHCTFTQRRNQSFKKKKKNSKQNIWKYLYSLKRSYWQFLKWNFSWGMDTHTHTSYWLDYCTIFHWQVELKKS